ncbi:MAG: MarR family transcriptional regulator [Firmicutes bacterium HGW-Firmicutes-16]|nr:MAG: MarR family transcriptional regulator [Firmicutes bacterium HGW-Firmicutes-16]
MLMSDLSIIVRGSHVHSTRKLSEYGINASEEYILMYLIGHSEANQEQIAKFFMLDKGTVARSLAKLEKKGFVFRKVNDENQREKVITLTEKTLGLKEVLGDLLVDWKNGMYDGMTDEEILAFEKTVEMIADNVTKML